MAKDVVKNVEKGQAKLKGIEAKGKEVQELKRVYLEAKDASLAAKKCFDTADSEPLDLITGEEPETPLLDD